MSDLSIPQIVEMPVNAACDLATECWRLSKLNNATFLYSNDRLVHERSVRRLNEMLDRLGVRLIDFAGTTYDPGMAPEVVEVQFDETLPHGGSLIDETILPTVMWNGNVIQVGQIVVRQSPKSQENVGDVA